MKNKVRLARVPIHKSFLQMQYVIGACLWVISGHVNPMLDITIMYNVMLEAPKIIT